MSTVVQQNGHTQDYELGFMSGAGVAERTQDRQLSSVELRFVAHGHYIQASKSVVVKQEDFERGWVDGYHAYFDGIV